MCIVLSFYVFVVCFFFFKQKTAYEVRISDWSSDVCSSDLVGAIPPGQSEEIALASCRSRYARAAAGPRQARPQARTDAHASGALSGRAAEAASEDGEEHRRRAADRQSVV